MIVSFIDSLLDMILKKSFRSCYLKWLTLLGLLLHHCKKKVWNQLLWFGLCSKTAYVYTGVSQWEGYTAKEKVMPMFDMGKLNCRDVTVGQNGASRFSLLSVCIFKIHILAGLFCIRAWGHLEETRFHMVSSSSSSCGVLCTAAPHSHQVLDHCNELSFTPHTPPLADSL